MFKCPKCDQTMQDYVAFLAPTYKTYMCFGCGSIFYELTDPNQLQQITANVLENALKNRDKLQVEVNKKISRLIGADEPGELEGV